ncbi:hypothetical protein [Streptomyces puniciscabiei]|uniref:hypothetical protein n=1 Tax=Streptomyces puniciscabiei TaxID=164348 RepID=UPI0037B7D0A6
MLLEDYEVEPDLSEPGDLSAAELSMAVRDLWRDFHRSAFSIRVVSVPSPTEAEAEAAAGAGAVGRIAAGDFGENFPMDLTYWGVERYQASWSRALKALERADDAVSCLVSSITDPANSNFVSCWPLYRSGSVVHIQNSIIFLEGIAEDFTPDEPWNFVEPRSTIDEDGNEISEWQTSMDEVREFLRSVRSWAG